MMVNTYKITYRNHIKGACIAVKVTPATKIIIVGQVIRMNFIVVVLTLLLFMIT